MKKLIGAVAAASMALGVASPAMAEKPDKKDKQNAAKFCKSLRTASGSPEAFAEAVRATTSAKKVTVKNAYGKCVSAKARENARGEKGQKSEDKAELNAAKQCKAEREQSDEEFGSSHDGKTFTEFYGTGKKGKNAFGKCVSSKAQAQQEEDAS